MDLEARQKTATAVVRAEDFLTVEGFRDQVIENT
jgi:hypothetical protein